MPAIAKDKRNDIQVVYGTGDSVMYIFSKGAKSFSAPAFKEMKKEFMLKKLKHKNTNVITHLRNYVTIFAFIMVNFVC